MVKVEKQDIRNINSEIVDHAFNILSVQGSYKLVGSRAIKNLIYANDYDLNENVHVKGKSNYEKLYYHFLDILEKCKKTENYYILDFKCGEINKEPI